MKRILFTFDCAPGQGPGWNTPPVAPSVTPPWSRPLLAPNSQNLYGDSTFNINYPITFLIQQTAKQPTGSPPVVNPYYITLPNGNYVGQSLSIFIPSVNIQTTAEFLMIGSISNGYKSIAFNNAATSALLFWDGTAWVLQGGTAQPSMATS